MRRRSSVAFAVVCMSTAACAAPGSSTSGDASASCAAPYVETEPRQAQPGGPLTVRGESHLDACDDTGESRPAKPLGDLPVFFQQGSELTDLGRLDASGPEGTVLTTITVPAGARPGLAQVTVGASQPALIMVGDGRGGFPPWPSLPSLAPPPARSSSESTATARVSRAAVRPAPADGSYQEALTEGVLRADPTTGCLWLERPDGERTQLLLHGEHYSVDVGASPAAVLDGRTVVASVGDEVEAGGGRTDREAGVEGCPVPAPVYLGYFERPAAPEPPPGEASPTPPTDPAGAEICKDSGAGSTCYRLTRPQATELAAALATGRPAGAGCPATPAWVHRIIWQPHSGLLDPVVWTVPSVDCLPMQAGGTVYDLDQDARDLVAGMWDAAGLHPVDGTTTGERPPSAPQH